MLVRIILSDESVYYCLTSQSSAGRVIYSIHILWHACWKERDKVVHKLPFYQRQQRIRRLVQSVAAKLGAAALIATLVLTAFVMPAFATSNGVLSTSGHGDGYYYECTYTPSQMKQAAYSSGNYSSHHANGYHVECNYTYNVAPANKTQQMPETHQPRHKAPRQNSHNRYNCTYTVQQGDNLNDLARRFGTTPQRIGKSSYLIYPYYVYPGNVLNVPCIH